MWNPWFRDNFLDLVSERTIKDIIIIIASQMLMGRRSKVSSKRQWNAIGFLKSLLHSAVNWACLTVWSSSHFARMLSSAGGSGAVVRCCGILAKRGSFSDICFQGASMRQICMVMLLRSTVPTLLSTFDLIWPQHVLITCLVTLSWARVR